MVSPFNETRISRGTKKYRSFFRLRVSRCRSCGARLRLAISNSPPVSSEEFVEAAAKINPWKTLIHLLGGRVDMADVRRVAQGMEATSTLPPSSRGPTR